MILHRLEDIEHLARIDIECEKCKVLEAWLEKESQEKKFFLDLALDINKPLEVEDDINKADYFPIASRGMTLSQIRQIANQASKRKSVIVDEKDLTHGEQVFQEALGKSS